MNVPILGVNCVTHRLVHVILNVCTKYEVYIFTHSKDIKGLQNFEIGHVT